MPRRSLGLSVRPPTFQGAPGAGTTLEVEVYGARLTEPVHLTASEGTIAWRGGTPGSPNGTHYADLPATVGQQAKTVTVTASANGITRTDTCVLTPTTVEPPPLPPGQYAPTRYVSPTGSSGFSGTDRATPTTLDHAESLAVPGDFIHLAGGTYERAGNFFLSRSGSDGHPITWWSDEPAKLRYAGATMSGGLIQLNGGVHHRAFDGLELDGGGRMGMGVCVKDEAHHYTCRRLRVHDTGATGVGHMRADYGLVEDCDFWRIGQAQGWSSAVSVWYGGDGGSPWQYDTWPGFHTIVNRVRSGGVADPSSYHSDGNTFIVDGPCPVPVLVANSLSYLTGGRGFQTLADRAGVWFVNLTACFAGLDGSDKPEFMNQKGRARWINCLAVSRSGGHAFNLTSPASNEFHHSLYSTGSLAGCSAGPDLERVDPLLAWKPAYVLGDPLSAPAPWTLPADAFRLSPGSPAIGRGADPSLYAATQEQRDQLRAILAVDLAGETRAGWDVGCYAA